jgi:hypothetical protein
VTAVEQAEQLLADGLITEVDRDAVADFAAFLRDTALHGHPRTWPPNLRRKHRATLGESHARLDAMERRLADAERAAWLGE